MHDPVNPRNQKREEEGGYLRGKRRFYWFLIVEGSMREIRVRGRGESVYGGMQQDYNDEKKRCRCTCEAKRNETTLKPSALPPPSSLESRRSPPSHVPQTSHDPSPSALPAQRLLHGRAGGRRGVELGQGGRSSPRRCWAGGRWRREVERRGWRRRWGGGG
ncbi:hypothetical protein BJY59DRAFT_478611 [Rhodotorula toruloides]